jgi:type II secretory pathway pseudopilin PulG
VERTQEISLLELVIVLVMLAMAAAVSTPRAAF